LSTVEKHDKGISLARGILVLISAQDQLIFKLLLLLRPEISRQNTYIAQKLVDQVWSVRAEHFVLFVDVVKSQNSISANISVSIGR
jgi:hypothetical protein